MIPEDTKLIEEIGNKHGLMMHDPIQRYHIGNAMEEYKNKSLENKDKEINLLEAREVAWANRVSQLNEEIAERNKVIFDLCDQMDGHLKEIERLKKEIEDKAIYTGNSLK